MRRNKHGLGSLIAPSSLMLASCAATLRGPALDAVYLDKVRAKASFDFDCPAPSLAVTKVEAFTYGASGCGHRATYHPIGAYCAEEEVFEDRAKHTCAVASDTVYDATDAEQEELDREDEKRQLREEQRRLREDQPRRPVQ